MTVARIFASRSTPGVTHVATLDLASGARACTCPGWQGHGHCWHTEALPRLCSSPCPACGGPVELVTGGAIEAPVVPAYATRDARVTHRKRLAPFGACTRCEFCIEVRPMAQSTAA